ncbi:hypothetical protein HDV00_001838 [Rhizophlyctis rosea]|nr:hypothetical protein HDV00_001838 [Rhizophlyctis rosea]
MYNHPVAPCADSSQRDVVKREINVRSCTKSFSRQILHITLQVGRWKEEVNTARDDSGQSLALHLGPQIPQEQSVSFTPQQKAAGVAMIANGPAYHLQTQSQHASPVGTTLAVLASRYGRPKSTALTERSEDSWGVGDEFELKAERIWTEAKADGLEETLVAERTRVVFGRGLEILSVATAPEPCRIVIHGLIPGTNEKHVASIVKRFGTITSIHVEETAAGSVSASIVFEEVTEAEAAQRALNGARIGDGGDAILSAGFARKHTRDLARSRTVTITWPAPFLTALLHFRTRNDAQAALKALEGATLHGRPVDVSFDNKRQQTFFSVWVGNLYEKTTKRDLERLFSISSMVTDISFGKIEFPSAQRKLAIRKALAAHGRVEEFTVLNYDDKSATIYQAVARFKRATDAAKAASALNGVELPAIRSTITVRALYASRFILQQDLYPLVVQKVQSLINTCNRDETIIDIEGSRTVQIDMDPDPPLDTNAAPINVHIHGTDPISVARYQQCLERILDGEPIVEESGSILWSPFFISIAGRAFLASIKEQSGATILPDARRHMLRVYGEYESRDWARGMVLEQFRRVTHLSTRLPIPKGAIRAILTRGGVENVRARSGADDAILDLKNGSIDLVGDEDCIRRAREVFFECALESQDLVSHAECPLCGCELEDAIEMPGCGHRFCRRCWVAYVTGEAESEGYPLLCPERQCQAAVSVGIIEDVLDDDDLCDALLETCVRAHVARHGDLFDFCPTWGCGEVYTISRLNGDGHGLDGVAGNMAGGGNGNGGADIGREREPIVFECPGCFTHVCTSCRVQMHDGLSCAQHLALLAEAEAERRGSRGDNDGISLCPCCHADLSQAVARNGGAHVECARCRVHICCLCTADFVNAEDCFNHVLDSHGLLDRGAQALEGEVLEVEEIAW